MRVVEIFTPHQDPVNPKVYATSDEVIDALANANNYRYENTVIRCFQWGKGCGDFFKVQEADTIQTHWYVEPYSCTGGDYWVSGERQIFCPHCHHKLRVFEDTPLFAVPVSYFKSVTEKHGR